MYISKVHGAHLPHGRNAFRPLLRAVISAQFISANTPTKRTNANNKTITASIRESWNGASVWESTIAANSVQNDSSANASNLHDPVTFYGSSVQLSTGTQYYLRLDTTASEKIYVHLDASSSYSPGHLINKDGNNESGKDLVFAIPEPSTALLVALGLMGMGFLRTRR